MDFSTRLAALRGLSIVPRWKAFSVADHLALTADSAWEPLKELGNEALKQGDLKTAEKLYHQSAMAAIGALQSGAIHAFITTLEKWPKGSSHRRLAETEDVLWNHIFDKLPLPPPARRVQIAPDEVWKADFPNKGAAIAWANHAHIMLLSGRPKRALRSARRATAANPEYVKAHHREMMALRALGKLKAAEAIREEMEDYETARDTFPAEALALLHAGWITWERSALVYGCVPGYRVMLCPSLSVMPHHLPPV
jgi:tetratricopeptide (TPR) repeat protein